MGSIKEKAQNILNEKNLKIVPENIKSGVTIFDVSGNYNGAVINNQDKVIAPSINIQNIIADNGYTGLNQVTINAVNSSIDPNITQSNIKNGVNILGVIGNYEGSGGGGSGDVKLFNTINEMQNSSGNRNGDLAVVYGTRIKNIDNTTRFRTPTFPKNVILPNAVQDFIYMDFMEDTHNRSISGYLSNEQYYLWDESRDITIVYDSADGIHYTRTTFTKDGTIISGDTVDFDSEIYWGSPWSSPTWDDRVGYFTQVSASVFDGLFEYQTNSFNIAETQFNASNEYVVACRTFYGNNGVSEGALGSTVSNTFSDVSSQIYSMIYSKYENMEPIVFTDGSININNEITIVPQKINGQSLFDTANVHNMYYMFDGCENLYAVSNFDTSNVTNMNCMFGGCKNLVVVPNFNTQRVTDMGSMFSSCSNLTSVPNLKMSSVTYAHGMFAWCNSLVNAPNIDLQYTRVVGSMFRQCTNLVSVPNYKFCEYGGEWGVSLERFFENCTNLTSVPDFDLGDTRSIGQMFSNCVNLVNMPNLNTAGVNNMMGTFSNCRNLTNVIEYNMASVKTMSSMFAFCNNLTNEAIQNIVNMCLNATSVQTKTLGTWDFASPLNNTPFNNSYYQNRWAELDAAGWRY